MLNSTGNQPRPHGVTDCMMLDAALSKAQEMMQGGRSVGMQAPSEFGSQRSMVDRTHARDQCVCSSARPVARCNAVAGSG